MCQMRSRWFHFSNRFVCPIACGRPAWTLDYVRFEDGNRDRHKLLNVVITSWRIKDPLE